MKYLFLVLSCAMLSNALGQQQLKHAKIEKNGQGFELILNDEPYFIKGAVGSDYLDKLKLYGGNSIRTGTSKAILDQAASLGLTALVGLPVEAERDGMNYDDTAAVHRQHEKVLEIVRITKDHPAVLMWALGNELDFIEANVKLHYNIKVWAAVNRLANEIHRIDPNHPVMTVVGSISKEKINDLSLHCPDIDLLGVNEYGDLLEIPQWLKEYGWKKPYAVTEWGPTGFWQVPKTNWKVPIEETSSMKAAKYKERYEKAIASDNKCLGSYVFLWRQHQERTHTWFGMFDEKGLETEAVDVMHYVWTDKWPSNRSPCLDSAKLNNLTAYQNVYLQKNKNYRAQVWTHDPDGDRLRFVWEILHEGTAFPYGGGGEKKPASASDLSRKTQSSINFTAPKNEGAYRLFVYVYDGNGHWATANIPFYVER